MNDSGTKYSQAFYQALFKFLRALKRKKRVLTPLYVSHKATCKYHLGSLTPIPSSRGNWGFTVFSPPFFFFFFWLSFLCPLNHGLSYLSLVRTSPALSELPKATFYCAKECSGVQSLPARCRVLVDEQLPQSWSVSLKLTDEADLADSEKLLCTSISSGGGMGPALDMQLATRDEVQSWKALGVMRDTQRPACAPFPLEEVLDCSVVSIQTIIHSMLSPVLPWGVQRPWC